MKKLNYVFSVIALLFLFTNFTVTTPSGTLESNIYSQSNSKDSRVYVCGGQYAEKFHSRSKCKGLNNCRGGIYYLNSQAEARKKGYDYCNICWKS